MSAEPDRRQAKTREAIRRAFVELMFERKYSGVTLVLVAERANVGRSTLYEHFRSKAELLRDALTQPMGALASVIGSRDVPAHLAWWLQHMRDNQAVGRVLFYSPDSDIPKALLADLIEARLVRLADAGTEVPLGLLARQVAAAQFAALSPWMLGQVAVSPQALAGLLHATSKGMVGALVEVP